MRGGQRRARSGRDDRDHHQQLDQRETGSLSLFMGRLSSMNPMNEREVLVCSSDVPQRGPGPRRPDPRQPAGLGPSRSAPPGAVRRRNRRAIVSRNRGFHSCLAILRGRREAHRERGQTTRDKHGNGLVRETSGHRRTRNQRARRGCVPHSIARIGPSIDGRSRARDGRAHDHPRKRNGVHANGEEQIDQRQSATTERSGKGVRSGMAWRAFERG